MKNKIQLDRKNRVRFKKNFIKRFGEKILQQNISYKKKTKILNSTGSSSRCRNLCIETGRGRGVSRFCQFSRIFLRQKLAEGNIMGWKKSSW